MTMQHNIDILGRTLGRNVLKPKLFPVTDKIDNQRPFVVAVAISAHNCHLRPNRAQFVQNSFRADVSQMPDLIRVLRKIDNPLRQFVMRISQDKNAHF